MSHEIASMNTSGFSSHAESYSYQSSQVCNNRAPDRRRE
jgi:hypothetical protein